MVVVFVVVSGVMVVVVYNDFVVFGLEVGMFEFGWRCFVDVSIVGIDDIDFVGVVMLGLIMVWMLIGWSGEFVVDLFF